MYYKTADLCDENKFNNIQVLSPEFKHFGGLIGFYGEIVTLKLTKSNWGLIDTLEKENGNGKILVIDANKEFYAIVGDKLSLLAEKNGYKAIIINGYIRDVTETKKFSIGLVALGTCPLRYFEKTEYEKDIELNFGGVKFKNGDYIYSDNDGIIISSNKLDTQNTKHKW